MPPVPEYDDTYDGANQGGDDMLDDEDEPEAFVPTDDFALYEEEQDGEDEPDP